MRNRSLLFVVLLICCSLFAVAGPVADSLGDLAARVDKLDLERRQDRDALGQRITTQEDRVGSEISEIRRQVQTSQSQIATLDERMAARFAPLLWWGLGAFALMAILMLGAILWLARRTRRQLKVLLHELHAVRGLGTETRESFKTMKLELQTVRKILQAEVMARQAAAAEIDTHAELASTAQAKVLGDAAVVVVQQPTPTQPERSKSPTAPIKPASETLPPAEKPVPVALAAVTAPIAEVAVSQPAVAQLSVAHVDEVQAKPQPVVVAPASAELAAARSEADLALPAIDLPLEPEPAATAPDSATIKAPDVADSTMSALQDTALPSATEEAKQESVATVAQVVSTVLPLSEPEPIALKPTDLGAIQVTRLREEPEDQSSAKVTTEVEAEAPPAPVVEELPRPEASSPEPVAEQPEADSSEETPAIQDEWPEFPVETALPQPGAASMAQSEEAEPIQLEPPVLERLPNALEGLDAPVVPFPEPAPVSTAKPNPEPEQTDVTLPAVVASEDLHAQERPGSADDALAKSSASKSRVRSKSKSKGKAAKESAPDTEIAASAETTIIVPAEEVSEPIANSQPAESIPAPAVTPHSENSEAMAEHWIMLGEAMLMELSSGFDAAVAAEAANAFSEALRQAPNDGRAALGRGKVLLCWGRHVDGDERAQKFAEAERLFIQAELRQRGASAFSLACLFAMTDRQSDARKWLVLARLTGAPQAGDPVLLRAAPELKNLRSADWFEAYLETLER